jgi:regulator of sigma E protease
MPDLLVTVLFVPIMIVGFGFIVAVHEFGHFLAARWAGIRVHAFAIGFGQAICSYRKGFGLQRGSSEARYEQMRRARDAGQDGAELSGVSPTEYRLNWIPFGGYVKMLGQDDADPSYRSDEPDSYQHVSIPKRMVVISAGVILNVVLAALLFMAVYGLGIDEASNVVAEPAARAPAAEAGVRGGDRIVSVNGGRTPSFQDVMVAVALAPGGEAVELGVVRRDTGERVTLDAEPISSSQSALGVQTIGVRPATSLTLWPEPLRTSERRLLDMVMTQAGLAGVPLRSTLVAVDGRSLPVRERPSSSGGVERYRLFVDAEEVIEASPRDRAALRFETPAGATVTREIELDAALQRAVVSAPGVDGGAGGELLVEHLLGLTPLIAVDAGAMTEPSQGLQRGDVFLRVGSAAYPTIPAAIAEIRSRAGGEIELVVLRRVESGEADGAESNDGAGFEVVTIDATVSGRGTVGFIPAPARGLPLVGATPTLMDSDGEPVATPAGRLGIDRLPAGARVLSVGGRNVSDFASLRDALAAATADAFEQGVGASVTIDAALLPTPTAGGGSGGSAADGAGDARSAGSVLLDALERLAEAPRTTVELELTADEVIALHELGMEAPSLAAAFASLETTRQAGNPIAAVGMGARATKRIIAQTYLTLRRLVEGTVPVNQLQGPVGITYTGSRIAEQGAIYVLYFMALISANLAVINFLPIPITDGGQFLLLCYEGVFGKPAPIVVQNALTLVGLFAIGTVFLYVTFHDILRIF